MGQESVPSGVSPVAITNGSSFTPDGINTYAFYGDASGAVGPVTITLSSPGYLPSTFTVTLS